MYTFSDSSWIVLSNIKLHAGMSTRDMAKALGLRRSPTGSDPVYATELLWWHIPV